MICFSHLLPVSNLLFYLYLIYVRDYLIILTMLIADMLEEAELGNFGAEDKKLACYFKCVMDKGGVVKQVSYKT